MALSAKRYRFLIKKKYNDINGVTSVIEIYEHSFFQTLPPQVMDLLNHKEKSGDLE